MALALVFIQCRALRSKTKSQRILFIALVPHAIIITYYKTILADAMMYFAMKLMLIKYYFSFSQLYSM
jgi:hypothetical protein